MANVVTEEPAEEPVSLLEAKVHCRIDNDDEDTYVGTLIAAARRHVEVQTRRSLITQTRTLTLPRFPARDGVRLLFGPVQSIDTVAFVDGAGADQTLAADEFQGDLGEDVPVLWPAPDTLWPDVVSETVGAVSIAYVAGYGGADDVPAPLKQAILLLVQHWHRYRGPVTDEAANTVPLAVDALIDDFKIPLMA